MSKDREFEPFYADSSTLSHENLICPYCQHQLSDSYEYFNELEGCVEMKCPSCDATFLASRHVRFSYYGCRQLPKLPPKRLSD
jgi:hypothetical protein